MYDLPACLVVQDRLTAQAQHCYELRFHFPARFLVKAAGSRLQVIAPDERALFICTRGLHGTGHPAQLRTRIETGRVSPCYGQSETALVGVIEAAAEGIMEFVTLIIPAGLSGLAMQRRVERIEEQLIHCLRRSEFALGISTPPDPAQLTC
jgi:hypothetical protein